MRCGTNGEDHRTRRRGGVTGGGATQSPLSQGILSEVARSVSGVNRTDRLYALVEELRAISPRWRSARELAERFEVSVRTIERDISTQATEEPAPERPVEQFAPQIPDVVTRNPAFD